MIIALAFLCYPVYVIRPFRMQGETELAVSLVLRRWAVVSTSACAIVSLLIASLSWQRQGSKRVRVGSITLASITLLAAAVSHVNIYEKMFHPVTAEYFVSAREAEIKDREMVLTMTVGNQHRAYPVSIMAYHHILNDILAGVPLAVTY